MFRIITTVGTSLITNYRDKEVSEIVDDGSITDIELDRLDKLTPKEVLEGNDQTVNKIQKKLNGLWIKGLSKDEDGNWDLVDAYNKDCCAEIKTLLEFYESKNTKKGLKIEVYLIATDTARSTLAAKLIKDNIEHFNNNIKIKDIIIVKGLQTNDYQKFEKEGINNLFKELDKIIKKIWKGKGKFDNDKTIINISGGYKAIIPYMTIFAQLYGIQSIYIYEDSSSLITIPPLPIQIDWAFAEKYYPYLSDPNLNKDKEKLNYLQQKGLLKYGKNEYERYGYSRTSLGSFFNNVIEKELHVSKSVMGFFFEYKLYEYYVKKVYLNKYNVVKHSQLMHKDKDPYKDVEIDLILSTKNEEDKDYIAIEVKPLTILKKKYKSKQDETKKYGFNKLKEQIEKHIETMRNIYGYAKEYHLCVYTPNDRAFNKLYNDQMEMIRELSKLFEGTPVEFKVFIIKANYSSIDDRGRGNSNPYQQLMKDELKYGENFKEIKY